MVCRRNLIPEASSRKDTPHFSAAGLFFESGIEDVQSYSAAPVKERAWLNLMLGAAREGQGNREGAAEAHAEALRSTKKTIAKDWDRPVAMKYAHPIEHWNTMTQECKERCRQAAAAQREPET